MHALQPQEIIMSSSAADCGTKRSLVSRYSEITGSMPSAKLHALPKHRCHEPRFRHEPPSPKTQLKLLLELQWIHFLPKGVEFY